MRTFEVMHAKVLTSKKKKTNRFSCWFYNLKKYFWCILYSFVLSRFSKWHQSLCNSKRQNITQNPKPVFFSFWKNNLANFRRNFGQEKHLRICQNCYILIQTKILNFKNVSIFHNTFTVNVFAWVSGKIAQWDWHSWNSDTGIHATLMDIQKCLCIKT